MGLTLQPKLGRAVVWRNLDNEGTCTTLTEHRAEPITTPGARKVRRALRACCAAGVRCKRLCACAAA
jgi:hypothetical protein